MGAICFSFQWTCLNDQRGIKKQSVGNATLCRWIWQIQQKALTDRIYGFLQTVKTGGSKVLLAEN
jgi:hypothetical protein